MDEEAKTETVMHPDSQIVLAVSGNAREMLCAEIAAYWYTWHAIEERQLKQKRL